MLTANKCGSFGICVYVVVIKEVSRGVTNVWPGVGLILALH